jgi:hypothetical protein
MLEKLKDTEVLLERKISKPINLPVFSKLSDALVCVPVFLPLLSVMCPRL